ncbi:MAG: hypothetical protein Kow0075_01570 [Salibacteraceae bacterium]
MRYDWRKEIWNLFFVAGIAIGAMVAVFLTGSRELTGDLNPALLSELSDYGISSTSELLPVELLSTDNLFSIKLLFMTVIGGFLVGFGTRYAGGCTSGHTIMGISNLQWPSVIATISFMVGGLLMANFILPLILNYF